MNYRTSKKHEQNKVLFGILNPPFYRQRTGIWKTIVLSRGILKQVKERWFLNRQDYQRNLDQRFLNFLNGQITCISHPISFFHCEVIKSRSLMITARNEISWLHVNLRLLKYSTIFLQMYEFLTNNYRHKVLRNYMNCQYCKGIKYCKIIKTYT